MRENYVRIRVCFTSHFHQKFVSSLVRDGKYPYLWNMMKDKTSFSDLTGHLLVAMPGLEETPFSKTVIYMCSHSDEGAMGLVVNQVVESLTFQDLLAQLEIESYGFDKNVAVHAGGPVDSERGFVLHSSDYQATSTIKLNEQYSLTATLDILRDMAFGMGPQKSMLALGYAGWGPGQLDQEILENGWLTVPADQAIVFDSNPESKWHRAMGKLGIDPLLLSHEVGHS